MAKGEKEDVQVVAAVVRALKILEAFERNALSLSLTEISQKAGLYKSTTLRLLGTLEGEGFVRKHRDGRYGLGPAVWRLGNLYEASIDLRNTIMPVLERISDETLETSSFDIREGSHRLCIGRIFGKHPIGAHPVDGAILPLGKGAPGRVLADYSDGPMEGGQPVSIYISLGERHPEMASISIPIFGINNVLHGALCIAGTVTRFTDDAYLVGLKTVLLSNAQQLVVTFGGDLQMYAQNLVIPDAR